ncbi:MAG: IgA Peptidase M64 [Prevotella sp.]|nr:IgA Peptidase M64 [Prevotella sp.]
MKRLLSMLCLLCCMTVTYAQAFDQYFEDRTLRIDYNFAGNAKQQNLSVDELNVMPRWYGKRQHLAELPMEGNGQITVKEHKTGKVIYRNSFSTLFQEWLSYPEAATATKSFENVFLVPFPKDTVDITLDLRNNRREIMASLTHQVVPTDILIRHIGFKHVTPFVTLQAAADTSHCIHLAYIAEGYKPSEMQTFIADAKRCMEYLFSYEPFKSMRNRFNIVAVEAPSQESGTSEPGKGIWKNTALHSHYDTFYSERYLTTLSLKTMHDYLAGTPYEHIIVLVNSERYGGGGILNSYLLSTTHNQYTKEVVVHEFGHSFCGLGDEYAYESEEVPMYPHDVEPWEANLTTLANFHGKWEDMIKKGTPIPTPKGTNIHTIGVYEGAGYSTHGVYRPLQDCRMRTNEYPEFCPVCKRALTRLIDFYTK